MRALPVLALLALVLGMVFVAYGGHGSGAAKESARLQAVGAHVVLADSDMPGFTSMFFDCRRDYHAFSLTQSPPTHLAFCGSAFVTNEALSGEGRAQIDAQTRADGNDPTAGAGPGATPWPDIRGPFVSTHDGIFEVSDEIWIESSPEAAEQLYNQQTADARVFWNDVQEFPSAFGDESVTLKRPLEPPPAPDSGPASDYEMSFLTIWRRGRVLGVLNTSGARDLQPDANWRLAALMDGRIQELLGSG